MDVIRSFDEDVFSQVIRGQGTNMILQMEDSRCQDRMAELRDQKKVQRMGPKGALKSRNEIGQIYRKGTFNEKID